MAGTHTSKTMMLREIRALLAEVPGDVAYDQYAAAIVEGNVLQKSTAATRSKTLLHMRHLYTLDGQVPLFAAFRNFWPQDEAAQPMLALLCATARDPLLRATAEFILASPIGAMVTPVDLGEQIVEAFPGRYKPVTVHHIGQNTGSSWNQAGYLEGRVRKYRTQPDSTPIALAFALYLGHLEGVSGPSLFETLWARIVGGEERWKRDCAAEMGRAGWIDYTSSGGMLEIRFSHLDGLTSAAF
jgi:hypothetical protein